MANARNVLQVVINGKNNAGGALGQLARDLGMVGLAASAGIGVAVNQAAQFERKMAEIGTLLDGDVDQQIAKMSDELLGLSIAYGESIDKLQKARYDVISAGFTDAAESSLVLQASLQLAGAGASDVATAADLMTTALNGMGLGAADAVRVGDLLFQTVRKGKTTIDELGAGFGKVFATANLANVSLDETTAVMALLTSKGIQTRQASTAMVSVLSAIAAPAEEASKALEAVGVNLDEGLISAMVSLSDVAPEGLDALKELLPNVNALMAAGSAAKDIEGLTAAMDAMDNSAGVMAEGFKRMQDTNAKGMDQLKAAVEALTITFGTAFLPVVGEVARRLAAFMEIVRSSPDDLLTMIVNLATFAGKIFGVIVALMSIAKVFTVVSSSIQMFKSRTMQAFAAIGILAAGIAILDERTGNYLGVSEKMQAAMAEIGAELEKQLGQIPFLSEAYDALTGKTGMTIDDLDKLAESLRHVSEEAAAVPPVLRTVKESLTDIETALQQDAMIGFEDLAGIAMNTADSVGSSVAQISLSLVGMGNESFTVGQAFKSLATSMISDIARIIARVVMARLLLKKMGMDIGQMGGAAGSGAGKGFFGGLFSLGAQALLGMAIPGGGAAVAAVPGAYAGMINVPGVPGMDRTHIMAGGGEMILSHSQANKMRNALSMPALGPGLDRFHGAGRSGKRKVELKMEARRPFRTSEYIELVNSVEDAARKAERYRS